MWPPPTPRALPSKTGGFSEKPSDKSLQGPVRSSCILMSLVPRRRLSGEALGLVIKKKNPNLLFPYLMGLQSSSSEIIHVYESVLYLARSHR